jgi:hypothetical protein
MNELIPIDTSLEATELINRLTAIALKAHANSPSPVEIKLELADLDPEMLMKLNEETAGIMKMRKSISHEGPGG